MTKVYVVGSSTGYARWLEDYQLVDKIEDADIVFFTGGEDINPSLYKCRKHRSTYFNKARDTREVHAWGQIKQNQLVIGTCRGLAM